MPQNLFQELKAVLDELKTFLDDNIGTIRPAIRALAELIPQINELIARLIDLMRRLKTEIQNLDVSAIPGLAEASQLTDRIRRFLTAARNLLPDQSAAIDEVLGVADVVSGLPSLDAVRAEIVMVIDAIVAHLTSLQAA